MREMLSSLVDARVEGAAAVVPWERLRAGDNLLNLVEGRSVPVLHALVASFFFEKGRPWSVIEHVLLELLATIAVTRCRSWRRQESFHTGLRLRQSSG